MLHLPHLRASLLRRPARRLAIGAVVLVVAFGGGALAAVPTATALSTPATASPTVVTRPAAFA
jgi:hypothetical protein